MQRCSLRQEGGPCALPAWRQGTTICPFPLPACLQRALCAAFRGGAAGAVRQPGGPLQRCPLGQRAAAQPALDHPERPGWGGQRSEGGGGGGALPAAQARWGSWSSNTSGLQITSLPLHELLCSHVDLLLIDTITTALPPLTPPIALPLLQALPNFPTRAAPTSGKRRAAWREASASWKAPCSTRAANSTSPAPSSASMSRQWCSDAGRG